MGGVNNICTDKTGTLTKNLMTVTKIFIEEKISATFTADALQESTRRVLSITSMANTNANPIIEMKGNQIINNQIGNKT
jgi:Ca2+ transporting ATPase